MPEPPHLILFVSTRPCKRMIAKGKRTALLNDEFSRAVLLALFLFPPRNMVVKPFAVITVMAMSLTAGCF